MPESPDTGSKRRLKNSPSKESLLFLPHINRGKHLESVDFILDSKIPLKNGKRILRKKLDYASALSTIDNDYLNDQSL